MTERIAPSIRHSAPGRFPSCEYPLSHIVFDDDGTPAEGNES